MGVNFAKNIGERGLAIPQAGTAPARGTPTLEPTLFETARQRPEGPRFFGYHNDSSILARLAGQGVAPNAINLRIAQQMLRYGLPLVPNTLAQIRQLWQALGASSLVDLEALTVLFSLGLPTENQNIAALLQLLSGGPLSHLLARLTLVLKQGPPGQRGLESLKALLHSFWQLGNGPATLPNELAQFYQLTRQIREQAQLATQNSRLPGELAAELAALGQLFHAQELLQTRPGKSLYIPFFQWREQQPMPGEFLVQANSELPAAVAAGYSQLTLAVDTRNLGRITLDFTALRGNLAISFEVQDAAVKQLVEKGLTGLRQKLAPATGYHVAALAVHEVGQGRSISTLLPKRRDLRRLSRALGVI
ncbi:MAG: flagellar hook-length control protein FliK [Cyanobacteria bacterium NC_groundwater_1444_Ag_S-0.65um_54_12]|nr:flagellar hook-length control protein FliK [Cyanobacteria bacterium NC_groundwater_1444_Ag_S-0.65um_54_12]